MTRLQSRLDALRASGRKALVPFITAGDPSLEATVPVMHALAKAGADVIELGVPFSDPMADGPVIQRSSERALARGAGLTLRAGGGAPRSASDDAATPVVLMGYLNPVEIRGVAALRRRRGRGRAWTACCWSTCRRKKPTNTAPRSTRHGLALISLASPTTPQARLERLCTEAAGLPVLRQLRRRDRRRTSSTSAARGERIGQLRAMAACRC